MRNDDESTHFGAQQAAVYDKQFARLAPMRDVLHMFTRLILGELPTDARILVIGAGTGAEILALADANPGWTFVAVDPSAPMLDVCARRLKDAGIADRCALHVGYLDTLPASAPFDAATSILVSHFITDVEQRRAFYAGIRSRLVPGGYLISADIASDMNGPDHDPLMDVWVRTLRFAGMPEERVEAFRSSFGDDIAVCPPAELAALVESAGFTAPVRFVQTLFVHAHFARVEG